MIVYEIYSCLKTRLQLNSNSTKALSKNANDILTFPGQIQNERKKNPIKLIK